MVMSVDNHAVDPAWPPGTVRLEGRTPFAHLVPEQGAVTGKFLTSTVDISPSTEGAEVIFEPKPSSDPNDPLVSRLTQQPSLSPTVLTFLCSQNWPQWRKYVNFGFVSYYVMMVLAL